MSLLSLFATVVVAAELVISPLADSVPIQQPAIPNQPSMSFGTLGNVTPTPTLAVLIAPTPLQTATPSPTPVTYQARKKHYAVALLGDSMIDTLGPDAPHLKNKLTALFPGTSFTILNYGVGATNIDYGIERLTTAYTYLGKEIPSLLSQSPDVVVVESFGYNPYSFDTGAIDKHWLALATIVNTLKTRIPGVKIIIAATIAPNSKTFGDGAAGLSFSATDKWQRTQTIKQYLDSTVKFAKSQGLPLADAYHASLDKNGDGILTYINGGDHIHYSDAGKSLFAQKVTDTIVANHILE
jgi:hypothetical protein